MDPTNTSWAEQEDSLLEYDGNIPFPLFRESHNLISEYEAEICSCEVVEQTIDDVLLSSCSRNPQGGNDDGQEECIIVEDSIRSHVAKSEITLDPHLFRATFNERLIQSKIMTAAGSTKTNHSSCELYESSSYATLSTNIGAVSSSTTTGITSETLSKIWKIDYTTASRTLEVTNQLKSQGGSDNLSLNFGTNDRMLRYQRIAS